RAAVPLPRPRPAAAPGQGFQPASASTTIILPPAPPPLPAGLPVTAPLPRPGPPRDEAGLPIPGPVGDPERDAAQTACLARLAGLAEAEPEPPVLGPAGCETRELVKLTAIRLPGGGRIAIHAPFQPQTRLRCTMAEAFAQWVREDVVALTASAGPITGLLVDSSTECRTRNRVVGAKMSEHGTGNAIDVRAVSFGGGRNLVLTDHLADKGVRTALAESVCGRFMTVLGPGSDGYHESHVHLDLAERRSGTRLCKWEVRDASWKPPAKPKPDAKPPDAKPGKPAKPAPTEEPDAEPEAEPDAAAPAAAAAAEE
ncbi:extensin family protein, partial [Rhodoplanes elegans]|uniref:extensin-like domain-containing protein n=2 Tax=Rhodoplanes elegans TaxID=29408 RepID=UPI0011B93EAB